MDNHIYERIYLSSQTLLGYIKDERYEDANDELKFIEINIRRLDEKTLLSLSREQVDYLWKLVDLLQDSGGKLQRRRDDLVEAIAPLNNVSAVINTVEVRVC